MKRLAISSFVAASLSLALACGSSSSGSGGAAATLGGGGQGASSNCPGVSTTDGTTACNAMTCNGGQYCAGVNCLVGCENTSQCVKGELCDLTNPQMSFNNKPLGTCRPPPACGTGAGGSSSTQGAGGGSSASCLSPTTSGGSPACATYGQCVQTACDTDLKACIGPAYASGTFSGPCQGYVSCVTACGCTQTCESSCQGSVTASCATCIQTYASCANAACPGEKQVCQGNTMGGGGTSSMGGVGAGGTSSGMACASLVKCCQKIQDQFKQMMCAQIAGSGFDQECAMQLTTYQAENACP